jgi:CheY-like chemotaxis protein
MASGVVVDDEPDIGEDSPGLSTHAFLAAAREAGAHEILTKPFDLSELLAAIRRQLPN